MTLSRFTVAFALALSPLPALAQGKCEIDEKKPNQVKDAANALAKVALPIGKPEDKIKSIQQAVGLLTKDQDKIIAANALGRSYVLGRAYALYAELAMGQGRDSAATFALRQTTPLRQVTTLLRQMRQLPNLPTKIRCRGLLK